MHLRSIRSAVQQGNCLYLHRCTHRNTLISRHRLNQHLGRISHNCGWTSPPKYFLHPVPHQVYLFQWIDWRRRLRIHCLSSDKLRNQNTLRTLTILFIEDYLIITWSNIRSRVGVSHSDHCHTSLSHMSYQTLCRFLFPSYNSESPGPFCTYKCWKEAVRNILSTWRQNSKSYPH